MNVVLIIIDSLQKNYVGAYGNKWIRTPNLDRLAKQGCIFNNAYPESLPTLQVRVALYSGRRLFPFRENLMKKGDRVVQPGWGPVPEEWITLPEILQQEGYRTALITDAYHQFKPGKNFHRGFDQFTFIRGQEDDAWISGFLPGVRKIQDYYVELSGEGGEDTVTRNKVRVYMHERYFKNTAKRESEEDYFAPKVFREAVKWLYQNQDVDKFFLTIDCFDPHEPWDPPTYYRKIYDPDDDMKKDIIWPTYSSASLLNQRQIKRLRANYAGEVTMVDRWLGYFLDSLDYMNLAKNTLLIVISDHGHHVGEKNLVGKFPYPILPEVADLVLFIKDPEGKYAGKKINDFVYNFDLAPTILSFLGIKVPEEMEGIDLIPVIEGKKKTKRDHITVGWQNNVMVKTQDFWYVGRLDRSEELLFHLADDPEFESNIAPGKRDICEKLHGLALQDAGGSIPDYVQNWPKYKVYGGIRW